MKPFRASFAMLLLTAVSLTAAAPQQITIMDTGSTNRRGTTIVCRADGSADVRPRNSTESSQLIIPEALWQQLASDVQAASPLADLPVGRCFKSVSFGSRLYVEVNGDRSPDLTCTNQQDERVKALKNDADAILRAAK